MAAAASATRGTVGDLIQLRDDGDVTGGARGDANNPATWGHEELMKALEPLALPADVLAKVAQVELTGADVLCLTPSELKQELRITKLQARRMRRALGCKDVVAEETAEQAEALAARSAGSATAIKEQPPAASQAVQHTMPPEPKPASTGVDVALVEEWGRKTTLIAKLQAEQVNLQLPTAQQRLTYLTQLSGQEMKKVSELQEAYSKLDTKHQDIAAGTWYPGKYLLGQNFRDKKLSKAQDKASEVGDKLTAAKKVLVDVQRKCKVQEQLVAELRGKVASLSEAQRWEASALQAAFGGSAGDARENAIEAAVAAVLPQLEQTRHYKITYTQAYDLIKVALKQLARAASLFQSAFGLSGLDVMNNLWSAPMSNTRGGVFVDVAKRAQARQGAALCDAAAGCIMKAKQVVPGMPRIDVQRVAGLRGIGLGDVVFDNIISDMRARRQIQDAMRAVDEQLRDVTYAERWFEGWMSGRIDQDLAALEADYARKKADLDNYRRHLMQQMLQHTGGNV